MMDERTWAPQIPSHMYPLCRVEAPIIDHLRDYALNLEKYRAVQFSPVEEDRNQEDCKFFGNFIPYNENIVNF
jgi:hypothetical protein